MGAIAGLTIFLGLPIGRLRHPAPRLQAFLNATAIGVLVFLLWDVLSKGWQPVEDALTAAQQGRQTWLHFGGLAGIFGSGLTVGLVGLVYYERYMSSVAKRNQRPAAGGFGPGAASADELA
ncbi:MAG: zinc permease, partial [Actinomycetota bacterium]|nr:zinc permease [Actinomycetota bacterium]